jgi:ABC-type bacteriocin/lantibiotic exporter with double-glycine peptidase domain
VALARAVLQDPPMLAPDEATSRFDPEGEVSFIERCRSVLEDRTVPLITIRPASLVLADRMLGLSAGRLGAS